MTFSIQCIIWSSCTAVWENSKVLKTPQSSIVYPPGPSSIIAGKLFRDFMRDPIRMLMEIEKKYGEVSHFKLGKQHIYLISDPKFIESILIRDHGNFIKSKRLQLSKRLLGEGLLTSEGEIHEKQRRIIQPAFHPSRIRNYGIIMTSLA